MTPKQHETQEITIPTCKEIKNYDGQWRLFICSFLFSVTFGFGKTSNKLRLFVLVTRPVQLQDHGLNLHFQGCQRGRGRLRLQDQRRPKPEVQQEKRRGLRLHEKDGGERVELLLQDNLAHLPVHPALPSTLRLPEWWQQRPKRLLSPLRSLA